ncbi:MAG: site-2 protease family protein [Phycisphaerales bacterium]|nr:site-2 protease family protein [Phycisphaerales bacterium]
MTGSWWVQRIFDEGGFVLLFTWVVWVIGSIVLHELSHGWAAIWEGDDTPRRLHRMTINPWVHMGPASLIVFAVLGIAWGLMPVDPSRFRHRRWGRLVVAFAGPAMNIGLALVALTALALVVRYGPEEGDFANNLRQFLFVGGWLNLVLAVFNLLPIPPLDGSTVLGTIFPRLGHFYAQPQAQMIGMFALMAILISNVDVLLFHVVTVVAGAYAGALSAVLP